MWFSNCKINKSYFFDGGGGLFKKKLLMKNDKPVGGLTGLCMSGIPLKKSSILSRKAL